MDLGRSDSDSARRDVTLTVRPSLIRPKPWGARENLLPVESADAQCAMLRAPREACRLCQSSQLCGLVFHFRMLDGPREHLGLRGTLPLADERLDDQIDDVPRRHEAQETPQEPVGLERIV